MTTIDASTGRLPGLPRLDWKQGAPLLAAAVLALLMAARIVDLVRNRATPATPPAAQGSTPVSAPRADIAAIQRARLFGGEDVVDGPPAVASGLVLAGVLADQDPSRGVAMLGLAAESVALYRVGEEVPNGARLQSIYPTYVLLQRGGQTEKLDILAVQPGTGGPLLASADPEDRRVAVARLLAQIPIEPGRLLRTQVVRSGGKLQGYRIYPGAAQKVFERSGLRRGDVVVAVNGHTAADPEGRGDLMRVLGSDRRARVTINRDGTQQEVMINLDDSST